MDELSPALHARLGAYADLLDTWNQRINLVSRRTTRPEIVERHVRHSLALHARPFAPGSRVVDWGTGGGLPGLVLALAQPEVEWVLVDSIRKKTVAVEEMARELGLDNVTVWNGRAETWDGTTHYAVSRATAPLSHLWRWTERVLTPLDVSAEAWAPGLLALKGGDLSQEVAELEAGYPHVHVGQQALAEPFSDKLLVTVTG
jgi:16S rRNA (guanine527-N7)-methyltransferase